MAGKGKGKGKGKEGGKSPGRGGKDNGPERDADDESTDTDVEFVLSVTEEQEADEEEHAGDGLNASSPRRSKRKKSPTKEETFTRHQQYRYRPGRKFKPPVRQVGHGVGPGGNAPMLVFFNAKGGTLKSTHTWNTAHTMSSELRGLRVLAVDLDSQQDLSRSMLRKKFKAQAQATQSEVIDVVEHFARPFTPQEYQDYNRRMDELNSSLQPGEGPLPHARRHEDGSDSLARTLMGAVAPMFGDEPDVLPAVPEEVGPNLFLLSGSPTMEDIDRRMTIAEGQLHLEFQRNWQGAPIHVIRAAAKYVKADIVLLDCNPSLSTINRNVIMSSDYVVITTRPEDFSFANVHTFVNRMAEDVPEADVVGGSWLQQMHHTIRPNVNQRRSNGTRPPRYPLPVAFPKILGCVVADFASIGNVETTRNPSNPEGQMSTPVLGLYHDQAPIAIQGEITRIEGRVRGIMNDLTKTKVTSPSLPIRLPAKTVHMTIGNDVYQAAGLTCLLARIRSYHSLGPLTHNSGVPAPFIRKEHCVERHTGAPLENSLANGLVERAGDFKRRYDQLAWNILKLMNDDPTGKLHNRLGFALQDHRKVAGGPPNLATDTHPFVPNPVPGY